MDSICAKFDKMGARAKSSVDRLNLGFPFYRILPLIQSVIGEKGTVLFPTYPNRSPVSSYEYLRAGNVFDVKRTPSFTAVSRTALTLRRTSPTGPCIRLV